MPGMRIEVVQSLPTGGAFSNGDALIATLPAGLSSFGVRTTSTPVLWDPGNSAPGTMSNQYGGGWPNACSNPLGNMTNRAGPFQALGSSIIQSPTPYTPNFLAGNHLDVNVSNGGNAVMWWIPSYSFAVPVYSYAEGYEMHDPNWWYCAGSANYTYTGIYVAGSNQFSIQGGVPFGVTIGDDNQLFSLNNTVFVSSQASPCKISAVDAVNNIITMTKPALVSGTFGLQSIVYDQRDENDKKLNFYGDSVSPYPSTKSWYTTNAVNNPKSNIGTDAYTLGQFNGIPINPDNNGHSSAWGASNNPSNPNKGWRGGWFKWAYAAKWSTGTDGFLRYWEIAPNGVSRLIVNYSGPNAYTAGTWGEAIGGYARNQGAMGLNPFLSSPVQGAGVMGTYTQWRYYGNNYYDRDLNQLGRFYLTNSSTYTIGDGNPAEVQPYIGWAPSTVPLVVNKGNLLSGPANLWFVDEVKSLLPVFVKSIMLN